VALIQLKNWTSAIKALKQSLVYQPGFFEAIYLLANTLQEISYFDEAISEYQTAIHINPNYAPIYYNLGNAFKSKKKFEAALENYDKALSLDAIFIDAYVNRGVALKELGHFENAIQSQDKALAINKDCFQAYINRGNIFKELNRYEDAVADYERAIILKPDYAEGYSNRGVAFDKLNRLEEALVNYNKAIGINVDYAEAYYNRGVTYGKLYRLEEAITDYKIAISLKPDYVEAYSNLGVAFDELNSLEEALVNYDKAISIKVDYAEAYYNRGVTYGKLCRLEEALTDYDKAISINGEYAEAYWNKSLILLLVGSFRKGWELYEWRLKNPTLKLPAFISNKSKPENIFFGYDKKLLIIAEQGVGDQVLYASMLDKLFNLVPSCQVMLDSRLTPLLSRSFPNNIFIDNSKNGDVIEHDEYLSIADLGKFFRTSIDDFEFTRNSYLIADKSRAAEIRQTLINEKKLLCGITWRSTREKIGASKSISLEHLLPILNINNISFVSLQYGDVKDQLIEFNKNHNVNIQECNTVDNFHDLDGHAALIEACDFVVTISNTSAHFSGALGKKTYLLSSFGKGSLWYWSNHLNGKSIWYPNLQIFEQTTQDQWDDVVQKIKSAIESNI